MIGTLNPAAPDRQTALLVQFGPDGIHRSRHTCLSSAGSLHLPPAAFPRYFQAIWIRT